MQIDYPFHLDGRGRTALTSDDDHIRDLIEQVLFTTPGERVNRPTFGTGLMQLVFAPNSDELATATQFLIQGALQQWLGDLIQIEAVQVESQRLHPGGDRAIPGPPQPATPGGAVLTGNLK